MPTKAPLIHAMCPATKKRRYRTQRAAENVLAEIVVHSKKGRVPRRAYKCPACRGWHLTSTELRTPEKGAKQ